MAEELKALIEKIQEEGVRAAESKAADIERRASATAAEIVAKARKEADRIISDAKDKAARMEESGHATLRQAGRDLILTLRKEINATLERIVASHVHKALSPDELADMITAALKECHRDEKHEIVIMLRKEDLERLEKGFMNELRAELKKGMTLKAADDIRGGFMISYDSGRSYYDFTDKSLAHYLATALKPGLADILDDAK